MTNPIDYLLLELDYEAQKAQNDYHSASSAMEKINLSIEIAASSGAFTRLRDKARNGKLTELYGDKDHIGFDTLSTLMEIKLKSGALSGHDFRNLAKDRSEI